MSEITKIIDESETQKKQQKQTKTEKNIRRTEAVVKLWELNDFVVHLSFHQLICKASLIFKSNLD